MSCRQSLPSVALSSLLLGISLSGCGGCPAPPDSEPLRLDVPLGTGEVRCGPVTRESELIGGPGAYGQVGRAYRCYNARIRFLVQDASRPVGNSAYGGNLIDLDLVRDEETSEGFDTFRELAVGFGANEVEVESIEVLNDGKNGEPGVVRVSGRPAPMSLAPQAYYLRQDLPARVATDYILRPDVDYVEVKTTLTNLSDDFIEAVLYADFLVLGGAARVHSPEYGFAAPPMFSQVSFLAAGRGDRTSYAYVCSDDDVTVPLMDSGITVPICRDDVSVGIEESYSRYVVVGDGSLESVLSRAFELRDVATGVALGRVTGPGGEAAPAVWVSALRGGGADDGDAVTVNQARTALDGRFSLTLPPGQYTLVAHVEGRGRAEAEVVVAEGGTSERDLELPATGRLVVETRFVGRDGAPEQALPAKLSVLPLDGTQRPSERIGDRSRGGLASYVPSPDGAFQLPLPPGRYRLFVTRGFEHSRFEAVVDVREGETTSVTAALQHAVDTSGLIGAEFHQHTLGSVDAEVPVPVKVLENAAEGVELTASTDHDNVVDFTPWVRHFGLERHLVALAGNEVSYQGIGHFNAYPWQIDPADPYRDVGSRVWVGKTLPELFSDMRAMAGDPIVQLNHPRSTTAGAFLSMRLDPTTATRIPRDPPALPLLPPTIYEDWSPDFDAIEVNGSLGSPELFTEEGQAELRRRAERDAGDVPVLADWFALLGAGMAVAAMGNSDTHHENEGVGYPRSFLRVGKDAPAEVTADDVGEAIGGQRVAVGEGCLVELWVGGERPMGKAEAVAPAALSELRVRLQAPPHVRVERLELYVNGRAQGLRIDQDGLSIEAGAPLTATVPERQAGSELVWAPIRGLPAGDLAIVALARGGSGLSPTGGGTPFCYSAPLYVDEGGDGWRGWLEDSETVSGK